MTAQDPNLIDVIVSDHREVEKIFSELETRSGSSEQRRQLADHVIAEHAEAEEVMKQLEHMDATDPRFDELVDKLIADVRHHIEEEEGTLLPRMAQSCSAEELRELGAKVLRAKKIAPTRPHPSAPDKPPANLILAPGAGLIDRLRDALSGRDV